MRGHKNTIASRAVLWAWLGLLLVVFHLCTSSAAVCYILSVGHLPPLRKGNTVLLITDLSGSGPAVKIGFHDESGREVPNSPVHKLLPPRGKIQIDVENYLQTIGTIILESLSEQIAGEYWQIYENGTVFMLPFRRPGAEGRYFVNCFRPPSCRHQYLVLSDPVGTGPLVQMEFYDRSGELIKIKMAPKLLRPYSTLTYEVGDYAPLDTLGKISVRSFGGSIVPHYLLLYDNDMSFAIPARLPARELVIDRFSTGRGITGNLIIADASAEGPVTRIQFRDKNGVILGEREKLLPPNGTVMIDPADYVDDVNSGTISISSESGIIADYWEWKSQAVTGTPAVEQKGNEFFLSHFLHFEGMQNLLSLLNTGQEPVKVEIQFYASSGRKLYDEEVFLEPYNRVDKLAGQYFDGAYLGTIIVKSPNASLVVTSHILENRRHLGKVHAQAIR